MNQRSLTKGTVPTMGPKGANPIRPLFPVLDNAEGLAGDGGMSQPDGVEGEEGEGEVVDLTCQECNADGVGGEAQDPIPLPDPGKPTAEQLAQHRLTHLPFRAWCPDCVVGKAKDNPHLRQAEERKSESMPTISFDYGFASELKTEDLSENCEKDETEKHEEKKEVSKDTLKILVVKDQRTKSIFGHAVPQKGIDEQGYVVKAIAADIAELGYRRICLKCDQEPSTRALVKQLLKVLNVEVMDQAMKEHPAPGDSQSNGSIENGVQQLTGQMRTMKSALENRIGGELPVKHPVMSHMCAYAGQLLTRYGMGHDGKTPYERLRGRKFMAQIPEFGERVWYKYRTKNVKREVAGKLKKRWGRGIMLGMSPSSNEFQIFDGKLMKARSVRRMPEDERWIKAAVEAVNQHPYKTGLIDVEPQVVFEDRDPAPAPEQAVVPVQLHDVYVTKADVRTHGYTVGCKRCDAIREGRQVTVGHSEICRRRVTEALGNDHPRVRRALTRVSEAGAPGAEVPDAVPGYQPNAEVHPPPVAGGGKC